MEERTDPNGAGCGGDGRDAQGYSDSTRRQGTKTDVRDDIRKHLYWEFSYASVDPMEARCLVTNQATEEGETEEQVREWFVRKFPARHADRVQQQIHSQDALQEVREQEELTSEGKENSHNGSHRFGGGLESKLEQELRFHRKLRGTSVAAQSERPNAEQMSPIALLERLYSDIPMYKAPIAPKPLQDQLLARKATAQSVHLSPLRGVYEFSAEGSASGVKEGANSLAIFEYEKHSLQDVLKYNRHVLHDDGKAEGEELALSDMKKRFLIYQLRRILHYLHNHAVACGGFSPSDILLTDTLWVRLGSLPFSQPCCGQQEGNEDDKSEGEEHAKSLEAPVELTKVSRSVDSFSTRSITERWCDGDMSNFEYLMLLNKAAGRRMIDGVFHPFLPWVTDFRARGSGWRDLCKSKFRLNKGDNQLDRTYENSVIPHHITESLSEITYYIYLARRTPMLLLRQVVRSNFQSKEYPSSIARMYDWTPDECIPEFYTEPDVFKSIHGKEMEDLGLPSWCEDAHDFIHAHRSMLEGDQVSSQLHTWIDLNFGVSLSGDRAVKQKNVPLQVQKEARLGKSPGFIQVFHVPHPARKTRLDSTSETSPKTVSFQQEGVDREKDRLQFSSNAYRPSEMKKKATGMLAKAMLIVNDCNNEAVTTLASDAFDMTRIVQSSNLTANGQTSQTGVAPSDSKSQPLVRLKQKRKTKARPRSHGPEPPLSPPSSTKDGNARSPTVSRLATVIPNFFHPDSAHGSTPSSVVGGSTAGGSAFAFPAEPSSSAPAVAVMSGPMSNVQHGDGAIADHVRMLPISAPLIHGVSGEMLFQHPRSTPAGNSTSPHTGSHIFRDLWQQISKPEELDSDSLVENSGYCASDCDWSEVDYEHLDDMDLQLLRVGLPIKISTPNDFQAKDSPVETKRTQSNQLSRLDGENDNPTENSVDLEKRASLRRMAEAIIDPAYLLPRSMLENIIPDTRQLTDLEFRRAADLFSLGCIIAEIYTLTPLFSKRSIVEYFHSFVQGGAPTRNEQTDMETKLLQPNSWNSSIVSKLREMPINVKNAVLALIHPNPKERLLLIGVLDGKEVFSILSSLHRQSGGNRQRNGQSAILDAEFCPSQSSVFPAEFALIYRFLTQFHGSSNWDDRFDATRLYLPSLVQLSPQQFRVVLPVISQFFQASSHTETIRVERVVAAIVFLLPSLNVQLDKLGMKQEMTRDVLRAFESSELTFLLKICLSAPEVLKGVVRSFGNLAFIECFLPVLVDWIVSAPSCRMGEATTWASVSTAEESSRVMAKIPLFAPEACSVTALALGEVASPNMLGPSLASKYILSSLLPHLGKIKGKWTKLTKASTHRRKGSSGYGGAVNDLSIELSGRNNDGIHVTFMTKSSLYESHYVADAILLVCREIGEYPVRSTLLPHIFDVLPQLIVLAEKIGSVRVEGVPGELGREIYVTLRILRHVIRNLSEEHAQSELLNRKSDGLVDMLGSIEPPFLHPRTAAAIIAAATSSETANGHRHEDSSTSSSNPGDVNTTKQKILRSLSLMKKENHRDLRAFIAVGLARTIVAMCQKVGPDATVHATPLVQGINKFLTRCSVVYSELEVSNFQWHLASEIVSEFCTPLRNLLGKDIFCKYFPIVQSNSVLQLLLLPIGETTTPNVSVLDNRLANPHQSQLSDAAANDEGRDDGNAVLDAAIDMGRNKTPGKVKATSKHPHNLLQFAYRTVRLNAVNGTSFLHFPSSLLTQNQQDLNDETLQVQEARRKRTAISPSSLSTSPPAQRAAVDSTWLRPLVKKPYSGKLATEPVADEGVAGGNYHSFPPSYSPMSTGSSRIGILESWSFTSEIRNSIKAHSSGVRSISVDLEEDIVLSGSKNGSCRAWRLASHPCHAQAGIHAGSPILSVQNVMDGAHAIAVAASCVHVWDIRTSQVRVKLPFIDENVNSIALLRTLPLHPHLTNSPFGASATLGSAAFAVSTARRVVCVDLRSGPRVAADWRVDVRDAINISAIATVFSATSSQVYIAAGTVNGMLILIDRQTGKQMAKWQAIDGKIIKVVQFSPSQILIVGVEREACVWNVAQVHKPRTQMLISGIPEAIRDSQVSVQSYSDMNVLYIACSSKLYTTRLTSESDALRSSENDAVPTARAEASTLMEPSSSSSSSSSFSSSSSIKMSKSKISSQSICVLPLRQLIVLGSDDGFLKCVL